MQKIKSIFFINILLAFVSMDNLNAFELKPGKEFTRCQ